MADMTEGSTSRFGLTIAVVAALLDQLHKYWMLNILDLQEGSTIRLAPFLDIRMTFNKGISYGLLKQDSPLGRWMLVVVALGAIVALVIWLTRVQDRLSAASLGLITGGAAGNAIDRIRFGSVADFFSFHVGSFYWYIFNIADVAIVAGVAGLLYGAFKSSHKSVENNS